MWTSKVISILLLIVGITALSSPAAVAQGATCGGQPITVDIGAGDSPTNGPDVIWGTRGDDLIKGRGGRDILCGRGGDDILFGGGASDEIYGGNGDDSIHGGKGPDRIFGQRGNDSLFGNAGRDSLNGGKHRDLCLGGSGPDTVRRCETGRDVAQPSLLHDVRGRGVLRCGVSQLQVGFSATAPDGRVEGFDADFCRAVAAAVLGDAEAVAFTKLTNNERFASLTNDTVDVVFKNTAKTTERDTAFGIDFGPPTFFDGVQLMGRQIDGFSSASTVADIDGTVVCTNAGTPVKQILLDAIADAGVLITLNTFEDFDITTDNFVVGACDLIAHNGSTLVSAKAASEPDDNWVIFPSRQLSIEPLSPMYIENDPIWAVVIDWVVYATVRAEFLGVDSNNFADQAASGRIAAKRLLGTAPNPQQGLGLSNDAFLNVIAQVGNYGEIYERNLEQVGLTRAGSLNELWSDGGLIYSPPIR